MFSDLLSEAGASTGPGVEEWSLEEPQKEDSLSIQMWRLYARTKANLPHAQRMEDLTWRMVGMALRRQRLEEQMQAHQHPQQQYLHDQMMKMKMKEQEQDERKVVPVDEQADIPDRGRRLQKYGGSAAIPGSMTTTSAPTITRVKAKAHIEGFEERDGYGCVFLFYFYFLRLFVWKGPCTNVMVWCTGIMKRNVRTKGWTGVRPHARSPAFMAQGGSGDGDRDGLASWQQEPESISPISTPPSNHWHTWFRL